MNTFQNAYNINAPRVQSVPYLNWPIKWYQNCLCCSERICNDDIFKPESDLNKLVFGGHLAHTLLQTHGCKLSTVATDALVLQHQANSIHSAEYKNIHCIGPVSYRNITVKWNNVEK